MANIVYRDDRWVRDANGRVIPGAQVYWCSQPATIVNIPPSPLASLFTNSTGNIAATNPQTTDGFGHCSAYLAAGIYTVVFVYNGSVQQIYTDQAIGINTQPVSVPTGLINVKSAGAFGDGLAVDGVANVSGNTLTLSSSSGGTTRGQASFSSADVGKTVRIYGAGTAGVTFQTTILSFVSSTQVTLAAAAPTTVSGTGAVWYPTGRDDTAAINAAMATAGPEANVLYFPAGVYIISSTLSIPAGIVGIQGDNVAVHHQRAVESDLTGSRS